MNRTFRHIVCCSVLMLVTIGCRTPLALRRETVSQSETVADIHQQQVLDNLAKFIADPYAIPSFAILNAGTTEITDHTAGGIMTDWVRTGFNFFRLSANARRQNRDTWTTVPIIDPRKLELMRCAYQRTLSSCGVVSAESTCCPDCRKRFNQFYTGRAVLPKSIIVEMPDPTDGDKRIFAAGKSFECDETGRLANLVAAPCEDPTICQSCASHPNNCQKDCAPSDGEQLPTPMPPSMPTPADDIETYPRDACSNCYCSNQATPGTASVTSECLYSETCWFCWSCDKAKVPKCCPHVGHHCGTYVWVPAGPGRDELAKLTLAIMDYAQSNGASVPKKTVYAFLDKQNQLTTYADASFMVTAEVSSDDLSRTIVKKDLDEFKQQQDLRNLRARQVALAKKELNVATSSLQEALTSRDSVDKQFQSLQLKAGVDRKKLESALRARAEGSENQIHALRLAAPDVQPLERSFKNLQAAQAKATEAEQAVAKSKAQLEAAQQSLLELPQIPATPWPSPVESTPTPTPFENLLFQQQMLDTVR